MKNLVILLISIALSGCLIPDKETVYKQYMARYERAVFITSSSYTVSELGGFWGASDICESHANTNPNLAGKRFIAYLASAEPITHIIETLPSESVDFLEFRLTSGHLFNASKSFFINYKSRPINIDENGNEVIANGAYYGFDKWGRSPTSNCNEYTTESPEITYIHHANRYYPKDAIEPAQCDSGAYHLYCVQQGD